MYISISEDFHCNMLSVLGTLVLSVLFIHEILDFIELLVFHSLLLLFLFCHIVLHVGLVKQILLHLDILLLNLLLRHLDRRVLLFFSGRHFLSCINLNYFF